MRSPLGWPFRDWTSSYRLFSKSRLPIAHLFAVVRRAVVSELPPGAPVCAVLDDTLVRRSGLRTPGVAWRRDPLGPRFQTNFVRAQRFLQTSLVLPSTDGDRRVVPIAFRHAPTPPKPGKKATEAAQAKYRVAVRTARLGQRAVEQIRKLRAARDADPASAARGLLVAFDGGYTNQTVLQHLPHHTTAIGRIRQAAKLLFPPDPATRTGRGRRRYGSPAPTPEHVRTDDSPWQTFTFAQGGATHPLRFKRRPAGCHAPSGVNPLLPPTSPLSRPCSSSAPKSGAADSASNISPASRLTPPAPRSLRNATSPSPPLSATLMPEPQMAKGQSRGFHLRPGVSTFAQREATERPACW